MTDKTKHLGPNPDVHPEEGDWVRVWGQVVNKHPHPEDYTVRFQSHNEDYNGLVRRDWVHFDPNVIPWDAERCNDMFKDQTSECYYRCVKHHDHSGPHHDRTMTLVWEDKDSSGYFEER